MVDPESIYNWHRLDDRITTSGQPSETQLADIAALGVRYVINLGLHSHEKALPDEAVQRMRANRKKGAAMSNHGTALSDDTIIRVDRSAPVVYPHYWWLKNVAHPEFQAKGPPEYDLATVELWLHKGQESARRVAGNLIKGQKKGRGVTGSLIYEHLLKNNMLVSCLGFADGLEIQKKGILVFRKFFNGKGLYLWNSVAEDLRDGLQVSFLAELGDEVVMGWRWLGHIWDRDDPAARFPS